MVYGSEIGFVQDDTAIKFTGQSLQYSRIHRIAKHNLPETCRHPTVFKLIVVVVRPNTVFGSFKNITLNNAESKPENKIKAGVFYFFNIRCIEILSKTFLYSFTVYFRNTCIITGNINVFLCFRMHHIPEPNPVKQL